LHYFVLIGPGNYGRNPKEMATVMLDVAGRFCAKNPSANLNLIQIVIFQPEMLQSFADSLQQQVDKNSSLWTRTKGW
jgi:hypothetical protein